LNHGEANNGDSDSIPPYPFKIWNKHMIDVLLQSFSLPLLTQIAIRVAMSVLRFTQDPSSGIFTPRWR
jgi:hypothetical protein